MSNATATRWGFEPSFVTRPAFTLPPDGCVQVSFEQPVNDNTPEGFNFMCLLRGKSIDRALKGHDLTRKNFTKTLMQLTSDGLFHCVWVRDEVPLP